MLLVSRIILGATLDYWWIFWLRIEISLWATIPFIFKSFDSLIRFIYWQSIRSLVFIFFYSILKTKICVLVLVFKISLPPFHVWFLRLIKAIPWKIFFIFIFIGKVPYILVFMHFWYKSLLYFFIIFPLIMFIYFWLCISFKYLIWILSICEFPWSYLSSKRLHIIWIYLRILLLIILIIINEYQLFSPFILLVISGLPPFRGFQIKILITSITIMFKAYLYLVLLIRTHIFIWIFIFSRWFNINIVSLYKKSWSTICAILIFRFLWLLF